LFAVNLLETDVWFSIGLARLAETSIRKVRGKEEGQSLGALDKILASSIGGAFATWNQPIEVIRVEVSYH
jgi:shikimate kinase